MLADCKEAIGEVGGFSLTVRDDLRLYLIQAAEKGMAWLRLRADGTAGHGSMTNDDNAVIELAEAVARIGRHKWPLRITPTVAAFLAELSDVFGVDLDPKSADLEATMAKLGTAARMIGASHPQHREPDDARGRLQAERHPRRGHRVHRRPLRARARRRSSCRRSTR